MQFIYTWFMALMNRKPLRKLVNELIIYDFDDTLLKTIAYLRDPLHNVLYEYIRQYYEPELAPEDFLAQSKEFYSELKSTILGWRLKHGAGMDFERKIMQLATPHMVAAVAKVTERNEARLARLRRLKELGYTLVILTHNDKDFCLPLMKEFGYDEFFQPEHVYDLPTVGHRKEVVESYQHVLDDLNRHFDKIHMVDDTAINLKCAKELGMQTHYVYGENQMPLDAITYVDFTYEAANDNYEPIDRFMDMMILRAA